MFYFLWVIHKLMSTFLLWTLLYKGFTMLQLSDSKYFNPITTLWAYGSIVVAKALCRELLG